MPDVLHHEVHVLLGQVDPAAVLLRDPQFDRTGGGEVPACAARTLVLWTGGEELERPVLVQPEAVRRVCARGAPGAVGAVARALLEAAVRPVARGRNASGRRYERQEGADGGRERVHLTAEIGERELAHRIGRRILRGQRG